MKCQPANLQHATVCCRGLEHGVKSDYRVLDACVKEQIKENNVMLDGEIIVWNKTR